MRYFCLTKLEAGRDSKSSFYMILPSESDKTSTLKKEDLIEQHEYKDFIQKFRPKGTVMVDYTVYQTEEKIHAAWQPEEFERLITDRKAEKLVSGELQIEANEKKDKHGVVRKKKKTVRVDKQCHIGRTYADFEKFVKGAVETSQNQWRSGLCFAGWPCFLKSRFCLSQKAGIPCF